jgi:hypothetical protein
MYPFSTAFFGGVGVVGNFPILKVCVVVYVPNIAGHKISEKGRWEWVEEGRNE